jgi:hypothetical protein
MFAGITVARFLENNKTAANDYWQLVVEKFGHTGGN